MTDKERAEELQQLACQMIALNERIHNHLDCGEYDKAKALIEVARLLRATVEQLRNDTD